MNISMSNHLPKHTQLRSPTQGKHCTALEAGSKARVLGVYFPPQEPHSALSSVHLEALYHSMLVSQL